jgi:hypothetical protein
MVGSVMNRTPRFRIGPKSTVPVDLEELGRQLAQLPEGQRAPLMPLYERILDSYRLRTHILNVAKEALERVRLEMACLEFDLEVTRREKETLKKQIEGG